MPTEMNESPPGQQDRVGEPGSRQGDEARRSASVGGETALNLDAGSDAGVERMEDPDINTHGSER